MRKTLRLTLFLAVFSLSQGLIGAEPPVIGIVNFAQCITDSKYGKEGQAYFETLKKKMTTLMEDTNKQLQDVAKKLEDTEYLDGLSPEGQGELKQKVTTLSQELGRYQQQYYEVMNEANMQFAQTMSAHINEASTTIANNDELGLVLNKEACFYYDPSYDITQAVITEMDHSFEKAPKSPPPPSEK